MKLEIIDSESVYHPGYEAGSGTVDTVIYKCPCGVSTVTRIKDNIPGFKDTTIRIDCGDCKLIYTINRNAYGLEANLIEK